MIHLAAIEFTLVRLEVPVSDADPASRIPQIHRICKGARDERSLAFTDTIAGLSTCCLRGLWAAC